MDNPKLGIAINDATFYLQHSIYYLRDEGKYSIVSPVTAIEINFGSRIFNKYEIFDTRWNIRYYLGYGGFFVSTAYPGYTKLITGYYRGNLVSSKDKDGKHEFFVFHPIELLIERTILKEDHARTLNIVRQLAEGKRLNLKLNGIPIEIAMGEDMTIGFVLTNEEGVEFVSGLSSLDLKQLNDILNREGIKVV